tara:strand:- start:183 stop:473 length:291 start_codon:yes stop_codon:yes gene_type:complete
MSDKIDYLRDKSKQWSSKYIIAYDKCYKCETQCHFRIDGLYLSVFCQNNMCDHATHKYCKYTFNDLPKEFDKYDIVNEWVIDMRKALIIYELKNMV